MVGHTATPGEPRLSLGGGGGRGRQGSWPLQSRRRWAVGRIREGFTRKTKGHPPWKRKGYGVRVRFGSCGSVGDGPTGPAEDGPDFGRYDFFSADLAQQRREM